MIRASKSNCECTHCHPRAGCNLDSQIAQHRHYTRKFVADSHLGGGCVPAGHRFDERKVMTERYLRPARKVRKWELMAYVKRPQALEQLRSDALGAYALDRIMELVVMPGVVSDVSGRQRGDHLLAQRTKIGNLSIGDPLGALAALNISFAARTSAISMLSSVLTIRIRAPRFLTRSTSPS